MDADKVLLIKLLAVLVVIAVSAIYGLFRHRGIQASDPLALCIVYCFVIAYLLYAWKNKLELVRRCVLAAPFAPLAAIALRVMGFETIFSILVGIGLFLFLLLKTNNWKTHFAITLLVAGMFSPMLILLRFRDSGEYPKISQYHVYLIFGLVLPFLVFYGAYLRMVGSQKSIPLRSLTTKSAKFAGALLVFFGLFIVSEKVCRYYDVGLPISFVVSLLISLCFLGICHRFKLGLSDSSGTDKNDEVNPKESIDNLKMKYSLFGGKDTKSNKRETCEFCGRALRSSEVTHTIKDHIVCAQCYEKIENEKTRIT